MAGPGRTVSRAARAIARNPGVLARVPAAAARRLSERRWSRGGTPFPRPWPKRSPLRPVVLFFAINGVGLGHLTRCLAIARHLGDDLKPVFVTTCRRAQVLDNFGIHYHYIPSFRELEAAGLIPEFSKWNGLLARQMRSLYAIYRPVALVYDGVAPYAGLMRAWRSFPEVGRIAVRRAYKSDGREERILGRDAFSHRIIIPHTEGTEVVPTPEGVPADWVGPVAVVSRDEGIGRAEARRALGLPADGPVALVQLGAGVLGSGKRVEEHVIDTLRDRGIHAVAARYDPGTDGVDRGVTYVHRYPMARYSQAFDFSVAAPGYNTFTELMHHGVPTLFVPNGQTVADDQVARARAAETAGAALVALEDDADAVAAGIGRLADDPTLRKELAEGALAYIPEDGSARAAAVVRDFGLRVLRRTGPGS